MFMLSVVGYGYFLESSVSLGGLANNSFAYIFQSKFHQNLPSSPIKKCVLSRQ